MPQNSKKGINAVCAVRIILAYLVITHTHYM